jgi:uncharacterized protein (TIGR03000 family)
VRFSALALVVCVIPANVCHAGPHHCGGWGGGPFPFYGYQGFYSNGFSMYGPPIPTYAPVPGIFNGSDQRLNYPPPYVDFPARPFVIQNPPPLLTPPPAPAAPAPPNDPEEALPPPRRLGMPAQLEVRVPVNARVTFNGDPTRADGSTRSFTTPSLEFGKVFHYELRAAWQENGREMTQTRTVDIQAGRYVVVDFTQPERTVQARKP